ncbi:MAG: hypothetical protein IJ737_02710 [Ruminococcus sp.]|nr:hypothetical protein [Ruminococcus sp.]
MKKLLACTLALSLSAAMFAGCGGKDDSSSSKKASDSAATNDAATTEAPAETGAADTTEAPEESGAASEGDDSASGGDAAAEVDASDHLSLSQINTLIKDRDTASLKFEMDTDVTQIIEMFNEEVAGALPGDVENYLGDEAVVHFSVQEVAGIPMLKCDEEVFEYDPEDVNFNHKTLKLRFDMNKLFAGHEEEMDNIFNAKIELVAIANEQAVYDDGLGPITVGWYGGAFGTNNAGKWNGNLGEWSMASNSGEGWCDQFAYTSANVRIGLKDNAKFNHENETNYLTLMAWIVKSDIDLYVADITFEDEDGNVIPVPEENIPGGATWEQAELVDADSDGIIEYAEDGTVILEN